MSRRFTTALLGALALSGCGGAGGGALSALPHPPATNDGTITSTSAGALTVTLAIPATRLGSASARAPKYVSPNTQSVSIQLDGGATIVMAATLSSQGCTSTASGTTCAKVIGAAPGQHTIVVKTYGSVDGSGSPLSIANTTFTSVAGQANTLNLTLNPVPAAIALSPAALSAVAGTSQDFTVNVVVKDASGAIIVGSGSYVDANGNALPIALADSNSAISSLPASSIAAPSTGSFTVHFNGATAGVANVTASAGSVTSNAAVLTAAPAPLSAYATTVLSDGAKAYYRFGDATTTMKDSGPSQLNGTYGSRVSPNVASLLSGDASGAASFPGGAYDATAIASAPANAAMQPSSAVSVEAIVKLASLPGDVNDLISYGAFGNQAYALQLLPSGALGWYLTNVGGYYSSKPLAVNTVHHVVATYDATAGQGCLYIDGAQDGCAGMTGSLSYAAGGNGLGIGNSLGTTSRPTFAGTLDEVAIYGAALTAAQVTNHASLAHLYVPAPTPSPAPSSVVASPASLAFLATGSANAASVAVSESGYSGAFTASGCSGIVSASFSGATMTVTPLAAGNCTLSVSGASGGASASVPVVVTTTSVTFQ